MAPAPEGRRGGLDLGNPGAKEYIIIGGTALGLALLYFWWKGRHPVSAPAASGGGSGPSTPTGLSTSAFSAWIHDHTSSSTTIVEDDDRHRRRRRDRDEDDERREDRDRDDRKRDDDRKRGGGGTGPPTNRGEAA